MSTTTTRTGKLAAVTLGALLAAVAIPALAGAQQSGPTIDQYEPSVTQISQGVDAGDPGDPGERGDPADPGDPSSSGLRANVGPLPFTGFDVVIMLAVALAVTGSGLALQRAVARRAGD